MNTNRRQFLQATSVGTAAAAVHSLHSNDALAADPFAAAEPGLAARLFNKNQQHVLPSWAFTKTLDAKSPTYIVSATPRPVTTATWEKLSGAESHSPELKPYQSIGDEVAIGKVLHGTAVEWNGVLIGGNKKFDKNENKWVPAASAWEAMRERVTPERVSEYGISDLGNWGKFGDGSDVDCKQSLVHCYKVDLFEARVNLLRNAPAAALYTYQGLIPGPTFRFRHGMPVVVRFANHLQTEVSIHHHGGHNPTHSDGFPSYYVLQGEARDYLYPNILPLRYDPESGESEIDFGEGQSTTWYHDHGLDATAFNVSHGLAGFALWYDELELQLIRKGILPAFGVIRNDDGTLVQESLSGFDPEIAAEAQQLRNLWRGWKEKSPDSYWSKRHDLAVNGQFDKDEPVNPNVKKDADENRPNEPARFYREALTPYFNPYDLPIVLQDRIIDPVTGQLVYDSNGHNGYIGNTQVISGRPWPVIEVTKRKYRFRILDGSNSRIYRLRFLDSETFRLRENAEGMLEPDPISGDRLNGSAMDFLHIGKDSWLYPMPQQTNHLLLNMANRADIVVDFKLWYDQAAKAGRLEDGKAVYYLVNTMPQFDGRGPKSKLTEDAGDPTVFPLPFQLNPANPVVRNMVAAGVIPPAFLAPGPLGQMTELNQPIGLVKIVIADDAGEGDEATIDVDTVLRPRHAIPDDDVMAVREFVFERGKGAWMINSRFYDPTISNASTIVGIKKQDFRVPDNAATPTTRPSLTYAEEWILRNGGGGWWHPIHIHLEGHQLIGYEKDFAADGLVGADGILGARAQAQMAGLPLWSDLVGKFGFNPLLEVNANLANVIRDLRDTFTGTVCVSYLTANLKGLKQALPALNLQLPEPQSTALNELALMPKPSLDLVSKWFSSLDSHAQQIIGIWTMKGFYAKEISQNPAFEILLDRPGAGAVLFPITARLLAATIQTLPPPVAGVVTALGVIRKEWASAFVANHDTQALGPNTITRIRMRFRTWTGPLVFHCHNVEHEDMRMMVNFEPTMSGTVDGLNVHDPNIAPTARTHGQDVTDLLTNPYAVGEMPWEAIDGFAPHRWDEKPVPGTDVRSSRDSLIPPRKSSK